MTDLLRGACHCGAVSVSIPASSIGVVACHCADCQKLHGNFFAMLVTDRDAAIWEGEDAIRWYASSAEVRRSFCGRCGSRLAKAPNGAPKLMVSVGLFPPDLPRTIIKHVWSESHSTWYSIN